MLKSWKLPLPGYHGYVSEGELFVPGCHAGLADYYIRVRGEAWGAGAQRLCFERGRNAGHSLAEVGIGAYTFGALEEGLSPCRTQRLVPLRDGWHVPGYDHQFSPDKSVSSALVYADREQRRAILRAHQRAVGAAWRILEDNALVCAVPVAGQCRRQGSKTARIPAELVAYATTHWASRPTEETEARGSGPDPQLHTHVLVFNLAWAADKWRAVDQVGLVHVLTYAEAVYQARLAHELTALGWQTEPCADAQGRRTFQLAGTNPELNRFFSSRHREVQAKIRAFEQGWGRSPDIEERRELAAQFYQAHRRMPGIHERAKLAFEFEHGHARPPEDAEQAQLARSSRLPKAGHGDEPDWSCQRRAAEAAGLAPPAHVTGPAAPLAPLEHREAEVFNEVVGPAGLHRGDATFERYQVRPAIWRASIGRLSPAETEAFIEGLETSGELVVVSHGGQRGNDRLTTRTNLEREQQLLARVSEAAADPAPAPAPEHVEAALAAEQARLAETRADAALADEQKDAVRHLSGPTRWAAMEGYAGTGKTTCTRPVGDAYRRAGLIDEVIMVSVAGRTARRSARKVGADRSCTVEALATLVDRGSLKLSERSLLLVDEVAMLDTDRAGVLLERARAARAIVRTIGDAAQAEAIGAGGWYTEADRRIGHATLAEVKRQKDPADRQACLAIRQGRAAEAIEDLSARDRVHVSDTHAGRVGHLLADYRRHLDAGRSPQELVVVTDTTNVEIDRLNRLIQDSLAQQNRLGEAGVETVDVTTDRTEVLHTGDRVVFTRNWRQHAQQVLNGSLGEVVNLDAGKRQVTVRLQESDDSGVRPQVRLNLAHVERDQPLRLAYAGYVNSAQGDEGAIVLALPGLRTTTIHTGYTMASRATEEIHLYLSHQTHGANPAGTLAERWSRQESKQTAACRLAQTRATVSAPQPVTEQRPGAQHPISPARPVPGGGRSLPERRLSWRRSAQRWYEQRRKQRWSAASHRSPSPARVAGHRAPVVAQPEQERVRQDEQLWVPQPIPQPAPSPARAGRRTPVVGARPALKAHKAAVPGNRGAAGGGTQRTGARPQPQRRVQAADAAARRAASQRQGPPPVGPLPHSLTARRSAGAGRVKPTVRWLRQRALELATAELAEPAPQRPQQGPARLRVSERSPRRARDQALEPTLTL